VLAAGLRRARDRAACADQVVDDDRHLAAHVADECLAGVDEARRELEGIVDFVKHPDQYGRLGARIPKGMLLVGPPGTGNVEGHRGEPAAASGASGAAGQSAAS